MVLLGNQKRLKPSFLTHLKAFQAEKPTQGPADAGPQATILSSF